MHTDILTIMAMNAKAVTAKIVSMMVPEAYPPRLRGASDILVADCGGLNAPIGLEQNLIFAGSLLMPSLPL